MIDVGTASRRPSIRMRGRVEWDLPKRVGRALPVEQGPRVRESPRRAVPALRIQVVSGLQLACLSASKCQSATSSTGIGGAMA